MGETTATLKNQFHTINFKFINLCNEQAILMRYSYNNLEYTYRGRSRKIYTSKKGVYFIHDRKRVYFNL